MKKILELYNRLNIIALRDYPIIVDSGEIIYSDNHQPRKLRLILCDNSFIDIFLSKDKYSYHWDRRLFFNEIYRHDNAPHDKWKSISTFPKHFNNGIESKVEESSISDNPEEALKQFMGFVKSNLKGQNEA